MRKLLPPGSPVAMTGFGQSCSLLGNFAAVGQVVDQGAPGRVHLFDLAKGKLLLTLRPDAPDDVVGNFFGGAVALTPTQVIVGAPRLNTFTGAVFVFNRKTGAQLARLQSPGAAINATFGNSLAVEGNVLIAGAPGDDNFRGSAYAYDLTSFVQIKKIQPAASVSGDSAGEAVAIHQGRAVLGASTSGTNQGKIFVVGLADGEARTLTASSPDGPERLGYSLALDCGMLLAGAPFAGGGQGCAYLFDLSSASTQELQKIVPADRPGTFGCSLALLGSTAVIGCGDDSSQALRSGAAYMMRPLTRPSPLRKIAGKGDAAPGGADIQHKAFGEAFINPENEICFTSQLTGGGSGGNKDSAVYGSLGSDPWTALVAKSRQPTGTEMFGAVSRPLLNRQSRGVFQAVLTGPGVNLYNNKAIYSDDGTSVTRWLRTGDPLASAGSSAILTFNQVVQSAGADRLGLSFAFRPGQGDATKETDTAAGIYDATAGLQFRREGAMVNATGVANTRYGQFTGRVAAYYDKAIYSAALNSITPGDQGVFQLQFNGQEKLVARKGDPAGDTGGEFLSGFIGESTDFLDTVLYRALLAKPASVATNEGLWTQTAGGAGTLAFRKGDSLPGLPSTVKIARFIAYWPALTETLALVQLAGPGVNKSNDQAFVLHQTVGAFTEANLVLMREGEPAAGCGAATIGTIHRVEVEPLSGQYMVLVTLAGAPKGTELALFRGGIFFSFGAKAEEQTLLRPFIALRKGQLFSNQPGKLKSFSLPTSNLTASGAGSVGLGTAIGLPTLAFGPPQIVLNVEYEGGVRQIAKGTP